LGTSAPGQTHMSAPTLNCVVAFNFQFSNAMGARAQS
jgi:hypothetical protein